MKFIFIYKLLKKFIFNNIMGFRRQLLQLYLFLVILHQITNTRH